MLFILLFGLVLLYEFHWEQKRKLYTGFKVNKPPTFIQERYQDLLKKSDPLLASFYTAASSGYKIRFSKKLKEEWKKLGTLHLLTPSGIHLGIILSLTRLIPYATFIIAFGVFSLGGFYSMERILFIKFFKKTGASNPFMMAMLLAVCSGQYQKSPLSFIYSFIFLGIFYSGSKKILTGLTIAHLIICWSGQTPFYILAPILNFALTALYGLIFPIILISFWLPFDLFHQMTLKLVFYFLNTADYSLEVLSVTPSFKPSLSLLFLLSAFLLRSRFGILVGLILV